MQTLRLNPATQAHIPILAQMNQRLVQDQGSRNPFTLPEFEQRFQDWLQGGEWQIDLFLDVDAVVGYSVYRLQSDYYYPDRQVVYLRQFYIERAFRRRGLGRAAFQLLQKERFGEGREVSLDVLATNPGGRQFWAKLGFEPYFVCMKKR